jgi:hypothetical protein
MNYDRVIGMGAGSIFIFCECKILLQTAVPTAAA